MRRSEFWIATATAFVVVTAGVEYAILLAMLLSLMYHVRRGYRPHSSLIGRGEEGHAKPFPNESAREYDARSLVDRFTHSMYYANAQVMTREVAVLSLVRSRPCAALSSTASLC